MLSTLYALYLNSHKFNNLKKDIIRPVLQRRKLRHRGVNSLAPNHTASE